MDEKSKDLNELIDSAVDSEARSDSIDESIYSDYEERSTLPEATLSDDVYADIMKNTEGNVVREEMTTRRSKYQEERHLVESDNPFQADRDKPEERIESYSDFNAKAEKRRQVRTFDEIFKGFLKKIFPSKGDKKSEIVRKLVADISVVTLVGCAIAFSVLYVQSNNTKKAQRNISGKLVEISDSEQEEKLWEEFHAKYPNITIPEGMSLKYAYLYALNRQLVGWVSVPNSGIDVQVVQAGNNSEYLKKDFYGNYSRYGCPFMDYRNDPRFLNKNTIIYGHHMSDGLIFAELSKYKELSGFLDSPVIRLDTLYDTFYFKVYAAFITNSREEDDDGYIFNYTVTDFASAENFDAYIKALDERKLYTTGVDINSADKLLTLSTCTYEFTDARLVIVGRMLRTGETQDIDTTFAVINGNPHYPQIWYTQKGINNPYAEAERWYPE